MIIFNIFLHVSNLCVPRDKSEPPVKMNAYLKVGVASDMPTSDPGIIVRVHDTGTGGDPYSTRSRVFVPRETSAELAINMKTVGG